MSADGGGPSRNKDTVMLQVKAYTWTIDLTNMVQINDDTQTRRPIRRTVIVKQGDITG